LNLLLAAGAGLAVLAALFILIGGLNISADQPDGWLTRTFLHTVFKRTTAAHAHGVTPPADLADPSRVRLAAQHFDMVCANCHGRPGFGQSVTALSMSPRPQYLPQVVDQFSDSELYEVVDHGVKFSAMPSWPTQLREDEVWSMVAFLRRLPKLDAKAYRDLTAPPQTVEASAATPGPAGALQPADPARNTPPRIEYLYAAPAAGFEDGAVHDHAIAVCARCHGLDGTGGATGGEAPNLTIQDPSYLTAALESYIRGDRRSGFMRTIAAELTEPQIKALSSYYAGLPVTASAPGSADSALVHEGALIAAEGVPLRAVPPCATCHESAGAKISDAPHIAGQSETYLRRQLGAMARGGRGSSRPWNPMPAVAHDLTDKEVAALAAYYSGLKPVRAASGGAPTAGPPAAKPPAETAEDQASARALFGSHCTACHVNFGRGDLEGNYPDLTLQSKTYVAQSLYQFRWGSRPGAKMRQATYALSLDQLAHIAAYVGSLAPQPSIAKPDLAAAARGAAIAAHGAPARGVPACLSCHGSSGVAELPLIPRLQGQNAAYLLRKLENFGRADGGRQSALNPMPAIVRPLTTQELADLAAYFAAAPPLAKTQGAQ
jgi:cytochrome c553